MGQSARLGSAPARLLCLLRARPAALDSSALPGREAGPLGTQPLPRVLQLAVSIAADPTAFEHPGLLLGARQLKYLARAYAVNIVLFLSALYLVATRGMGLRAVWVSLCAFQFVRLLQFSVRGVQIGLLPWPGRQ